MLARQRAARVVLPSHSMSPLALALPCTVLLPRTPKRYSLGVDDDVMNWSYRANRVKKGNDCFVRRLLAEQGKGQFLSAENDG